MLRLPADHGATIGEATLIEAFFWVRKGRFLFLFLSCFFVGLIHQTGSLRGTFCAVWVCCGKVSGQVDASKWTKQALPYFIVALALVLREDSSITFSTTCFIGFMGCGSTFGNPSTVNTHIATTAISNISVVNHNTDKKSFNNGGTRNTDIQTTSTDNFTICIIAAGFYVNVTNLDCTLPRPAFAASPPMK